MSSSNQLEIISRGSAEIFAPEAKSPCSLANKTTGIATTDVNTDQQISLEPLPPERPRCSDHYDSTNDEQMTEDMLPCLDIATSELAQSRLLTENLLQRIEDLSGKIRSGLSLVEDTGATVSTLLNDDDIGSSSDVMMMSSMDETHRDSAQGSSTCRIEENSQSKTIQGRERDEDDGGKDEGDERSVVSPQGDGDPKLIKALEKMRRLDKKLADLVMKEREVKEKGRELEQQIMGVDSSCSIEDGVPAVFPIFPTQVLEDDTQNGTEVVLSEAEKCRLEQLLGHDEDYVEAEDACSGSVVLTTAESNAFNFTAADQTTLRHIDTQLQALNHCVEPQSVSLSTGKLSPSYSSPELESQRLMEIDEKLTILRNSDSSSEPQALPSSVLHHLLEQCTREQLS